MKHLDRISAEWAWTLGAFYREDFTTTGKLPVVFEAASKHMTWFRAGLHGESFLWGVK